MDDDNDEGNKFKYVGVCCGNYDDGDVRNRRSGEWNRWQWPQYEDDDKEMTSMTTTKKMTSTTTLMADGKNTDAKGFPEKSSLYPSSLRRIEIFLQSSSPILAARRLRFQFPTSKRSPITHFYFIINNINNNNNNRDEPFSCLLASRFAASSNAHGKN